MPATKTRGKPRTSSAALRELRTRAGLSQEGLARELCVALQTVTLWETKRPPAGIMLARLADLALEFGYGDLNRVFEGEIEKLPPAIAADIKRERRRWDDIYRVLDDLEAEARNKGVSLPAGDDLYRMLKDAQAWAWRNQR